MSPLPDDVELVIFDCDGVLVDTEPRALEVDQRVPADVGWQLSADDVVERFLGRSEQHLIGQIEAHIGRSIASDWSRRTAGGTPRRSTAGWSRLPAS
jgi:beta-phosphoglucomutase-like phosphatase (HAD superfamily)